MKDSLRFVYAYQEEERTNPENGKTFFSGYWVKIKECQSFKHAIDEATRLQAESVKQGKPVSHCVNS
jgi:hypothetical protein